MDAQEIIVTLVRATTFACAMASLWLVLAIRVARAKRTANRKRSGKGSCPNQDGPMHGGGQGRPSLVHHDYTSVTRTKNGDRIRAPAGGTDNAA